MFHWDSIEIDLAHTENDILELTAINISEEIFHSHAYLHLKDIFMFDYLLLNHQPSQNQQPTDISTCLLLAWY